MLLLFIQLQVKFGFIKPCPDFAGVAVQQNEEIHVEVAARNRRTLKDPESRVQNPEFKIQNPNPEY